MSIIKMPNEIKAKTTATILIYGQPSTGKTTLACSSKKPVLFDFDGGIGRIHASHRVPTIQVSKWEDVAEALVEIRNANGAFSTIVVDTIGKMLDCIADYIKRSQPNMVQRDGALSLKGYGLRNNLWKQFLKDVAQYGMDILFIGHEKEEKRGDDVVKRADAGSATTANDLFKDLDLVGYLFKQGQKRKLSFADGDTYSKAPTSMQKEYEIATIIDANGMPIAENTYFQKVIKADYEAFLERNDEVSKNYAELVSSMKEMIEGIKTPKDADEALQRIKEEKHIFDSSLLAKKGLMAKATEMGMTFDKEKGCFVAPTKEKKTSKKKEGESNGEG